VEADAVDLHRDLLEVIEPALVTPPVVLAEPVLDQFAQGSWASAGPPARAGRKQVPVEGLEPVPELLKLDVGHGDGERRLIGHHFNLMHTIASINTSDRIPIGLCNDQAR
jgi:hypothetical protein